MQKTVLIIEDEAPIRSLMRTFLEAEGFAVIEAENGAEGLDRYQASAVDLVITDLIMPEKEGIETIRTLKKINPEVKIIAISGGGVLDPEEYLAIAKRMGVQRTLAKPFTRDALVKTVHELCA